MNKLFDNELLKQGEKLVELSDDSLLEVIGLQLLAIDPPNRVVGTNGRLSIAASIGELALVGDLEKTEALLPSSLRALSDLLKENRRRAQTYLNELVPQLKLAMCENGRLKLELATRIDAGELVVQVTAEVVASVAGLPPLFGSLAVTVGAWMSKRGLDTLCR